MNRMDAYRERRQVALGWLALAVGAALTLAAGAVQAGGFAHTFGLGGGTVAVTNSQANSSWVPLSVMLRYAAPGTGTAEVRRESQGHAFVLAATGFTNATTLVWVPSIQYPFGYGDVLVIESSVTNGVVQVLRRGG